MNFGYELQCFLGFVNSYDPFSPRYINNLKMIFFPLERKFSLIVTHNDEDYDNYISDISVIKIMIRIKKMVMIMELMIMLKRI